MPSPEVWAKMSPEEKEKEKARQAAERAANPPQSETDEEIKARWATAHHGTTRGWGISKRDNKLAELKNDLEYERGMREGRIAAARGESYHTERGGSPYNLGYHRGHVNWPSDKKGWTDEKLAAFLKEIEDAPKQKTTLNDWLKESRREKK